MKSPIFHISVFVVAILALACVSSCGLAQAPLPQTSNEILTFPGFHSQFLKPDRTIRIWLPPGYYSEKRKRYPVFYLHDGQNLFKGGPSFIPNQAWNVDTAAHDLIVNGEIDPIILVGIDNSGGERLNEYTPTENAKFKGSGNGDKYGKFLVEELKPFVDSHYRTLKDARNTALGGSSLGGLISLHLGLSYPKTFGKIAVLSPSIWWDDSVILHRVEKMATHQKLKIWLDIGSKEGDSMLMHTRKLQAALLVKGWKQSADLQYIEAEGASHNEKAWSERFPNVLKFLFGK